MVFLSEIKEADNITRDSEWVRPNNWVAMPTLISNTAHFLRAIFNTDTNYFVIRVVCTGNFSIQWYPETTPIEYASGTTVSYNEIYSNINASTEITRDGVTFRQALITLTGTNITTIELQQKHSATGTNIGNESHILEYQLDIASLTSLAMHSTSITDRQYHSSVERIHIGNNSLTAGAFTNCRSLRNITFTIPNNAINLTNFLSNCSQVDKITLSGDTINPRITSLSGAFTNCSKLRKLPWLNTANCTNFANAFEGCTTVSFIPSYTFNATTTMASAFSGMTSLKALPPISIPLCTSLNATFLSCNNLRRIDSLVTSNVCANFQSTFSGCTNLVSVPFFITAGGTNFTFMFNGCESIESIPPYVITNGTNLSSMFLNCTTLVSIPNFSINSATSVQDMFRGCIALRVAPTLTNAGSVTNIQSLYRECHALKTIAVTNFTAATNASNMFNNCFSLIEVGLFPFSSVTNVNAIFNGCRSLKRVRGLNLVAISSAANFSSMTANCFSLARFEATGMRFNFSVANCALSQTALVEIFNNLPTVTSQTITITGCPGAATLTGAERAIATGKGWIITG